MFNSRSFLFGLFLLGTAQYLGAQVLQERGITPNGSINTMDRIGNVMYFAGSFDQVGYQTEGAAFFPNTDTLPDLRFPPIFGTVFTIISDEAGGWFVGGEFRRAGPLQNTHTNLVHVTADWRIDPEFTPAFNDAVHTLALKDGVLYAGGSFTEVNDSARAYLAAIDLTTQTIDPDFLQPNNRVLDLEIHDSSLLLAGWFSKVGDSTTQSIAAIDLNTKTFQSLAPVTGQWVNTMTLDGDILYGGGYAPDVLFALDLSTNTALSWAPIVSGFGFGQQVNAIAVSDSEVYFGGQFATVNGESRSNVAAVNKAGVLSGFNPKPNAAVLSLFLEGDTLWMGGDFLTVGNDTVSHITKIQTSSGEVLSWRLRPNWSIHTIQKTSNGFLLGGEFEIFQYQGRDNAFALNLRSGTLTDWAPQTNFLGVRELIADPVRNRIYMSGNAGRLAAVDPQTGAPLPDWSINADGTISPMTLDQQSGQLYIGGNFTEINGQTRNRLAALDPDGNLLPFAPDVDGEILALDFSPETNYLYFAGPFNNVNAEFKGKLAAVDVNGQLVDWEARIENDPVVHQFRLVNNVKAVDDRVFVSGNFETLNGDPINGISAVDLTTGSRIPWDVTVNASRMGQLFPYGDGLFISGQGLTEVNGAPVGGLAYLSIPTGNILADFNTIGINKTTPGNNIAFANVSAFGATDEQLVIAGRFDFINEQYHPTLGIFDFPPVKVELDQGVEKVFPDQGGNAGAVGIQLIGTGFSPGTTFFLRLGDTEIFPIEGTVEFSGLNAVAATFDLAGQQTGLWDIVLLPPDTDELILQEAFEIIEAVGPKPWADVLVPEFMLANLATNFFLQIGNDGDTDAHGVPVWITISPNLEVESFSFEEIPIDPLFPEFVDSMPDYFEIITLYGEPYEAKVYAFLIPNIPAQSTRTIAFQVKTGELGPFYARAWTYAPWYGSPLRHLIGDCHDQLLSSVIGFIPVVGCAYGIIDAVASPIVDRIYEVNMDEEYAMNYFQTLGQTALGCAGDLATGGTARLALAAANQVVNLNNLGNAVFNPSCYPPRDQEDATGLIVGSIDPNDKVGPTGQGTKNWLNTQRTLSYMIRFENDPEEATAPAKEVIIRDTLDQSAFDLNSLNLVGYSIADSFYTIPTGFREYLDTIDLRPLLPYRVRTEVVFEENTSELVWSFLTLDTLNGAPITHPLEGFLPPNKDSISGTGAVLFTIRVLDTLNTGRSVGNRAGIYFDFNEPIITNTWIISADNHAPFSQLNPLADTSQNQTVQLTWNGGDQGSGIRYYDTYYRTHPDSSWLFWAQTADLEVDFTGDHGQYYEFTVVAVDTALNQEEKILIPEATTFIAEAVTSTQELELNAVELYPNPVSDLLIIEIQPHFKGAYIELVDAFGRQLSKRKVAPGQAQRIDFRMGELPSGLYLVRWLVNGKSYTRRVIKR